MKYLVFVLLFMMSFGLKAQKITHDELIVELNEGKSIDDLERFIYSDRSNVQLTISRKLSQNDEVYLLQSLRGEALRPKDIKNQELFSYVVASTISEIRNTPNDSIYPQQWNMNIIDLESVWEYTTGGETVFGDEIVVAVLDDGFHLDLEDWGDNIYSNPFEQEGDANGDGCPGECDKDDDGDGLIDEDGMGRTKDHPLYDPSFAGDDDENGYIDDIHGLYASQGSDNHKKLRHGTASAGVVGAQGNNDLGITGVNWNIKVMPLSSGLKKPDVIETYNYITDMRRLYNETDGEKGAFIVACNYSLGVDNGFPDDYPIWCSLYDKMGEQGIINTSAVSNTNYNIDTGGDIPSLCDSDYLITVCSTDSEDNFGESAFGKVNVDMSGPGVDAISFNTNSSSLYGKFNGTSAAAPHVAGVIGLLYSIDCPEFVQYFKDNPSKVDSLAEMVVQAGTQLESLKALTRSEKRLNAFNAMISAAGFCGVTRDNIEVTTLYPNPVSDLLNFEFNADPAEKIYLKIYNILGQSMYENELTFQIFENAEGTVNTSDLAQGVYFLSLYQGKKVSTFKFVKG